MIPAFSLVPRQGALTGLLKSNAGPAMGNEALSKPRLLGDYFRFV
jgi:hypothetical protein